jgi:gluconokinase
MTPSFRHLVVMGVSASGKTTLGRALAIKLGARFTDADDLHPAGNRQKMAAGIPLDDEDRAPWLETLASLLDGATAAGERVVLACSALKRAYRDVLRRGRAPGELVFLFLDVPRPLLETRLARRHDHFFSPSLLTSQLATLEAPTADEAVRVEVRPDDDPGTLLARSLAGLEISS